MQEEFASIVFERTPLATETLRRTLDNVPRKLRTLLLAVDGRSSVNQYVPFLFNLLPLSPKFRELELLGMLQRRKSAASIAPSSVDEVAAPAPNKFAPKGLDGATLAAIESIFMPSKTSRQLDRHCGFDSEITQLEIAMNEAVAPVLFPQGTSTDSAFGEPSTVIDVLSEMERFLGGVNGLDGLPLALMFGQIRSAQQLRAELPDYARLLAPLGDAAERHLAYVRGLLDRLDH